LGLIFCHNHIISKLWGTKLMNYPSVTL